MKLNREFVDLVVVVLLSVMAFVLAYSGKFAEGSYYLNLLILMDLMAIRRAMGKK